MTTTMRYLTLFASLAFMITSQIISASEPTTWDYKVLSVASDDADALQAQLVSLGNQGWDLNGVVARRSPNGPDLLVLKRAKSTEIESSQIETTIATAGAADGSAQSIFGDVEIEFVEETGLVTIRGSKEDVSRTLGVIHTIRAQEKSASKP